jgi:hypothetical protein
MIICEELLLFTCHVSLASCYSMGILGLALFVVLKLNSILILNYLYAVLKHSCLQLCPKTCMLS